LISQMETCAGFATV